MTRGASKCGDESEEDPNPYVNNYPITVETYRHGGKVYKRETQGPTTSSPGQNFVKTRFGWKPI